MSGVIAIYRREFAGLFVGPLAWILLGIALLLNGFLFTFYLKLFGGDVDEAVRALLGKGFVFWLVVLMFPPLITMRMISEESRSGLLEFLLTAPVTDAAVVTGKFCAALSFMALLWASVFAYAWAIGGSGTAVDWGLVACGWLGAVLCSGLFCATGLLASALTNVPVAAALAGCVLNIAIVLLPQLTRLSDAAWVTGAVKHVNVGDQLQNSFLFGIFDTAYIAFFATWTALFLFFAVRSVEMRRWR